MQRFAALSIFCVLLRCSLQRRTRRLIGNTEADFLVEDAREVARMINGLVRSLERPSR